MTKPIVLWTNIPSFHLIGPFQKLAETRETICVCRQATSSHRSDMWKAPDFGKLQVVYLKDKEHPNRFVQEFLAQYKGAAHFMSGFGTQPGTETFWKLAPRFRIKPIALAERPNPQRNPVKALLRDAYYAARIRAISKWLGAVLCMGSLSVDAYRRYGIPKRKLLPYMYTSALPFPELPEKVEIGAPLRFVYVGRDDPWIKGLDLLAEALKGLTPEQLTFDFIGPNPDSWLAKFAEENGLSGVIRVLGKLPNDQIAPKLANEYDVLALVGRYDGWGMTVSEALFSGLGVLASDACGSQDVARASGAGKVLPKGSVDAIRSAIRELVDNPSQVLEWKNRARAYRDALRAERLAPYLEEVVEYAERGCSGEKPNPYWLEGSDVSR